MKKIGCAMAVGGVLLLGCSLALFVLSIRRAVDARQVTSIPIAVSEEVTTDLIEVDTARLCQITLEVDVRTESVQEDDGHGFDDEKPDFEARYDFPFRYAILDADGNTVFSGSDHIAWNSGMRSGSAHNVNAKGGTVSVEHSYDKFKVSPPGQFRVRIEIDADKTYHAEARNVVVNIYDNVSDQGASVFGGFAMLLFGPVLIVIGIIVFFVGLFTHSQRIETEPRDYRRYQEENDHEADL